MIQTLSQPPRDPEFVQDPYPFYDQARQSGPLFFWQEYGFPCAAGYEAASAILRDRRFGREPPDDLKSARPDHLRAFYGIDALSMLEREPPAHTRLRRLVLRAFTSRRIAAMAPEIKILAHQLIDHFEGPEIDLLPEFAEKLPVTVIARLLGVPENMGGQLLAWSHDMVAIYQARRDRAIEDRAEQATTHFSTYLREYIDERRARPADDLITELIAAEADGDRLSTDELIATCILLLNAGHEATVHAIGNGVRAILDTPQDPRELFRDATASAATVEEVLRFDPPLHLFTRMALEDMEIFGHRFERGQSAGCLLAAANRDPGVFETPARFDATRPVITNLSFGAGIHFCVGAPLARSELAIALPVLFERCPNLALAATPQFADRYHFRGLEALRLRI